MKSSRLRQTVSIVIALALILVIFTTALAQDDSEEAMKADKTGTKFDARLYNEFLWLNTDGDREQNITTFEFRAPFADGKWQFRLRARYLQPRSSSRTILG